MTTFTEMHENIYLNIRIKHIFISIYVDTDLPIYAIHVPIYTNYHFLRMSTRAPGHTFLRTLVQSSNKIDVVPILR